MGFKIEWVGADEYLAALQLANDNVLTVLTQALYAEANDIMAQSQEIVPVDTGILKDSGTVLDPEINGNRVEVVMGYGGAASAYALRQHEDLSYRHAEGKQAKYLEQPAREAMDDFEQSLTDRIEGIIERGDLG
jgi:hypothetical protein